MSHDHHTTDNQIRELAVDGCTLAGLRRMAEGWEDPFPLPSIQKLPVFNSDYYLDKPFKHINVIRDDEAGVGSKGRFGSLLMQRLKHDTVVYVAPRAGWAPLSLAYLCERYGKRLILFAPASKEPSHHQQVAMSMGAEMRFYRVAAMPNLQKKAKEFADQHGYFFAPLGLRHPLITAAIINTVDRLFKGRAKPKEMWCAMSTGVLSRGLQLALPNARHVGVAVARNIKAGERGEATIHSHPMPFLQDEHKELRPPFPSASNYDAKVWRYMISGHPETGAADGAFMWNVAGEIELQGKLPRTIKSDVAWGDEQAFRRK